MIPKKLFSALCNRRQRTSLGLDTESTHLDLSLHPDTSEFVSTRARKLSAAIVFIVALTVVFLVLISEAGVACRDPYVTETSPDGRWTLTVCGRARLLAMPGSGSDAPGWIILRDEAFAIRGVASLPMLQLYGGAVSGNVTEWGSGSVGRLLVFDMPLDAASGPIDRWVMNRLWKLRTLFGMVPGYDSG
ncbi:hypothetical protein [Agrobacterium fabrum]|uniref:hypothetical protein n=1 Tax=Agrobacterium fabrum TaxID=1176649 RepID=UPI003B9FD3FB